jgi:hypothetical protein
MIYIVYILKHYKNDNNKKICQMCPNENRKQYALYANYRTLCNHLINEHKDVIDVMNYKQIKLYLKSKIQNVLSPVIIRYLFHI